MFVGTNMTIVANMFVATNSFVAIKSVITNTIFFKQRHQDAKKSYKISKTNTKH